MTKRKRQKIGDFDKAFDEGKVSIDFSGGVLTEGLSKLVKLPPIDIPSWLALEIDKIAKIQGNSRSSVVRQLLVDSVRQKKAS